MAQLNMNITVDNTSVIQMLDFHRQVASARYMRNCIFGPPGILLNIFGFIIIVKNRRFGPTLKMALVSLNMSDLLFSCGVSMNAIVFQYWDCTHLLCRPLATLILMTLTISYETVLILSIHNFVSVFYPLHVKLYITKSRCLFVIICIWLIGGVAISFSTGLDPVPGIPCVPVALLSRYGIFVLTGICIFSTIGVTVLNVKIILRVKQRNIQTGNSNNSQTTMSSKNTSKRWANAVFTIRKARSLYHDRPFCSKESDDVTQIDETTAVCEISIPSENKIKLVKASIGEDTEEPSTSHNTSQTHTSVHRDFHASKIYSTLPNIVETTEDYLNHGITMICPDEGKRHSDRTFVDNRQTCSNLNKDCLTSSPVDVVAKAQPILISHLAPEEYNNTRLGKRTLLQSRNTEVSDEPPLQVILVSDNLPDTSIRQLPSTRPFTKTRNTLSILTFWCCFLTLPFLIGSFYCSIADMELLSLPQEKSSVVISSLAMVNSITNPVLYAWRFVNWQSVAHKCRRFICI